jgi:hypothetical protein
MQEFIIIDGLPYLYADGKAYAVRWDDEGFTLGGIFQEDISPSDFIMLSELSVKAKCQGRLDSIGKPTEPEEPTEPETVETPKPKRGRKAKGEAE